MSATEQKEKLTGYSFSADLGNGRNLVIQFNTALEASPANINAVVDKFRGVIDRQQARSALIGHIENIDLQERKIRHMREDLESIDEAHARKAEVNGGNKRDYKIPAQERETRIAITKNLARLEEDLDAMKKYQSKLELEAGVTSEPDKKAE